MDKKDARYQKLEQLHERSKQVVRLYRKEHGVMIIVGMTGLSYPAVRLAVDLYKEGGYAALKPMPSGREPGEGRTLTEEQEETIRRTIYNKQPKQLKLRFEQGNQRVVMQLVQRKFGIKLSVRGIGNYLSRRGFMLQKPIKKAYEQRPEAIQAWLNKQYSEIEARAKAEGGETHWALKIILNILRTDTTVRKKLSLRIRRKPAVWDDDLRSQLLGLSPL